VSQLKNPKTSSPRSPKKRAKPASKATAPAFSYVATANQYARDVLADRLPACKWVKLACKRHLDDLARSKSGWRYVLDGDRASLACEFIESLPHTKGDWANRAERLVLQPWQVFILVSLFGWLDKISRMRRFTLAYIAVPRKNGKSILAGGIGDYMFCADGEFGSEVYSGATTEKQAWEVFMPAKLMVDRTPELREAFGITVGAKRLFIEANGSKFEPVIGKPGDGASPHCGIVDEYHEHDSDALFDTFRTGMGARKQPLLLAITTAGDSLAGPCKALQDGLEHVLDRSTEREELFGIVYTIDPEMDWTSEEALQVANPNYDVSVFGHFLKTEQQAAVANARKQNIFKTKHLNVWVGANTAYFNLQQWLNLSDPSLQPEEFRGLPCVAALDLSSKRDITARVIIFRKTVSGKDHFYVFPRLYVPEAQVNQPENQHYQGWVRQGFLKTTPGGSIDFEQIQADTIADCQAFRVSELCYDPWNTEHLTQSIEKATRVTAVEVPQQTRYLSDPMKLLDSLIADGRIHHDGNPVMTWMMGNVTAHEDANGNVFPRKEREEAKIDGPAALITGMVRAQVAGGAARSVYATRGVRVL
jgi:phage terminase large subunit-like protein